MSHVSRVKGSSWLLLGVAVAATILFISQWQSTDVSDHSSTPIRVLGPTETNSSVSGKLERASTGGKDSSLDEYSNSPDVSSIAASAISNPKQFCEQLDALSASEAVSKIREILNSKIDAETGLGFKLSGNGLLNEAPTLRTFLLDELARRDPAAAAEYSRTVLASKDSPDEWALALRNLARGDNSEEGHELLASKTEELLEHESWQRDPSIGYLEAFDVAVHLGGTELLPTLGEMIRRTNDPALSHASYLAMDRMVISDPTTTLTALLEKPDLMAGREQTRANYFARADVRDPNQRRIVEDYLINAELSPGELDKFAALFPNANFMISHNLLTSTHTPNRATLIEQDAESLRVVQEWIQDPRFENQRTALQDTAQRLEGFVDQANSDE